MAVPGKHGPVMIANVASLSVDSGPAQINRYDRVRNINFDIELNGVDSEPAFHAEDLKHRHVAGRPVTEPETLANNDPDSRESSGAVLNSESEFGIPGHPTYRMRDRRDFV